MATSRGRRPQRRLYRLFFAQRPFCIKNSQSDVKRKRESNSFTRNPSTAAQSGGRRGAVHALSIMSRMRAASASMAKGLVIISMPGSRSPFADGGVLGVARDEQHLQARAAAARAASASCRPFRPRQADIRDQQVDAPRRTAAACSPDGPSPPRAPGSRAPAAPRRRGRAPPARPPPPAPSRRLAPGAPRRGRGVPASASSAAPW